MSATEVLHLPRPSRVAGALAARLGPPAVDPAALAAVLDAFGLRAVAPPRNLRLGRRSRNVLVTTTAGPKVVKCYRPQWHEATVSYGHSVLEHLERAAFPAPRLARTPAGATWTPAAGGLHAVFDFLPGTNYSLTYLLRPDRLRLTATAGLTLAALHRCLDGFVPEGRHHLGFAGRSGPRRRDAGWHAAKLEELAAASARVEGADARALVARLVRCRGEVAGAIAGLERLLDGAAFPRLVIHGDYGPHNLLVQADGSAVPVDFELARLDWRLDDLVSALGKHRFRGGRYDLESMLAFLRAYAAAFPLTVEELALLGQAWRFAKLRAAVQYWNSYFETAGPVRKLASAVDALEQAAWAEGTPGFFDELRAAAAPARPARAARAARAAGTTAHVVMQVTRDLEIGGAQETVRTLARHLPALGLRTVVCTFGGGPLAAEVEALGVPVERLPARRWPALALPAFAVEMLRRHRDLRRLVARHGVTVVQTQGLGTLDFLVMTLRVRPGVQVWWTIQNAEFMLRREHLPGPGRLLLRPKRAAHRWLYRAGARLVDGVIAVSDDTASAFRAVAGLRGGEGGRVLGGGVGAGRLVVVPNAVELDRFPAAVDRRAVRARLGVADGDHVVLMVGTFKRQKGHAVLVEALAEVAPSCPSLRVLLVGDGELVAAVRARVSAAGLEGAVRFLGARRDVAELLAAADSFVLPSLWEGLPVALLEAMATGLPVVATDVSGTRQAMVDGETGWLVPPGDAAALASALRALLTDPHRAAAVGAAARRRAEARFGGERQARALAVLFAGPGSG